MRGKNQTNLIIRRGYDESGTPIDREIAGYIKLMNTNPDVYTKGSCFGHGTDTPFFSIEFRNPQIATRYISQFRSESMITENLWPPNGWSVSLVGAKQHRAYSKAASHMFWRKATAILTHQPYQNVPKGPDYVSKPTKILEHGVFEDGPYAGYEWRIGFNEGAHKLQAWSFWYRRKGTSQWAIAQGATKDQATKWAYSFMREGR